jgi:phosphatidylglycerol:prolipoprotein diacylglycerol transferase
VGIFLATRAAEREGLESQFIADLGLVVILSAVVGARLFHILFYDLQNTLANPGELLRFRQTGLVFYGGLVFAVAASVIYSKWKHVSLPVVADIAAPSIAIGQAIGRLGCLMSGCCYGRPASIPWAIKFPYLDYMRHPTQIYEMLATLAIFVALMLFRKHKTIDGQVIWLYLVLYAVARFVIEFFRGDNPRILMGLTISQVIGVLVLIAAVPLGYVLWFSSARERALEDAGGKPQ